MDLEQIINEKMEKFNILLGRAKFEAKEYQRSGLEWCLRKELLKSKGGIVADEMGLGKTIMMIGTMVCNYLPRTLIVLPPVLIDQWYLQIYRTTGHKALIYHGQNKKKISIDVLRAATIVITTYGAVTLTKKKLQGVRYIN